MVFVQEGDTGFIYLLKGYKTDFFRFNTTSGVWDTSLPEAPAGARAKWDKGSWLAYGGDMGIYAHKAKYHEFWLYDIVARVWYPSPLTGMPLVGMSGKSKKSKDGGAACSYDFRLYALKGGNTSEFWCYDPDDDQWFELDTMPSLGSTGRKRRVKAGGDIIAWGGDAFFAIKGNKTLEFWRYMLPPSSGPGSGRLRQSPRNQVQTALSLEQPSLCLAPTVIRHGSLRLQYRLPAGTSTRIRIFDVTGRSVLDTRTLCSGAGTLVLPVHNLSAGTYFVSVKAAGTAIHAKAILER
jgi:hypothetical protein